MATVTHNFIVNQMVFIIDSTNTVKEGVVQAVEIIVNSSGTTITYSVLVDGTGPLQQILEANVFGSCRAAPGYQDVVFLSDLTGSPSDVAISGSPLPGIILGGSPLGSPVPAPVLIADVLIDGTTLVSLSHTPVIGQTFNDIITSLNTDLGVLATASLVGNNIRITSATVDATSSVLVEPGSPQTDDYFRFLNGFTGLAAPLQGLGVGALETLSNQLCIR